MSNISIAYLEIKEIYQKFIKYYADNSANLNELIENNIFEYFEKECIICFEKLNKKNCAFNIFICDQCKNELHFSCFKKWMNFRMKGVYIEKSCPFCKNKKTNI